jgi:hypothetical protein
MKKIHMRCHGKIVTRQVHHAQNGKKYVMERKHGGGTKRKYL